MQPASGARHGFAEEELYDGITGGGELRRQRCSGSRAFRGDRSTYKFDVADYTACKAGVAATARDQGPASILVNNAGITRDSTTHKMNTKKRGEVIAINLTSCFNRRRIVMPVRSTARGANTARSIKLPPS